MMKINNQILSFAKVFIVLNLCLSLYALFFQNQTWLLNLQVAFFSSLFVTLASFLSYKKNIENRLSNLDENSKDLSEQRDKIDEIDDPFDLYSEYEEIPENELTAEKIKEIINDERKKVKQNSFKNTIFSATGFVSIYRILGYGFLIFGFFALNNNKILIPLAFIVGLSIVPIGVLFTKLFMKNN
jgi:ABC-type multidrug transport system fused ATPase/permease subunit